MKWTRCRAHPDCPRDDSEAYWLSEDGRYFVEMGMLFERRTDPDRGEYLGEVEEAMPRIDPDPEFVEGS